MTKWNPETHPDPFAQLFRADRPMSLEEINAARAADVRGKAFGMAGPLTQKGVDAARDAYARDLDWIASNFALTGVEIDVTGE